MNVGSIRETSLEASVPVRDEALAVSTFTIQSSASAQPANKERRPKTAAAL